MQRIRKFSHAILVLSALICLGSALPGTAPLLAAAQESDAQNEKRLIDGAKKEGKLAFWINGWNANELEQLFGKFRQKYPFITVEYWRAAEDTQLHQKTLSEARAGIQNVDIASSEINLIAELKKAGVVKKYHWPNTSAWSPQHKDTEGYKAVNYLKAFAKNNIVFGAGQTARLEMLGAGAFKIDLRLNLFRVLQYQKKKAPVEWVRTDPVLAKATPMLIAARAPHPNTALLFANWFTSLEGQKPLPTSRADSFPTAGLRAQRQRR